MYLKNILLVELVFHNQQDIPKVDTFALVSLFENTLLLLSYVTHEGYHFKKINILNF